MSIRQNEITCDGCGKHIETFKKPRGWHNAKTAEAHVCVECWESEYRRAYMLSRDYTPLLKEIVFPVRTLIGQVVKDDVMEKVMEKFGVSET